MPLLEAAVGEHGAAAYYPITIHFWTRLASRETCTCDGLADRPREQQVMTVAVDDDDNETQVAQASLISL